MATFANALISSAIAAKLLCRSEIRRLRRRTGSGAFPEGLQKQCKLLWTALKLRMLSDAGSPRIWLDRG